MWLISVGRCDERFVGYGGNKAACLFGIYVSGIDFYVLPDDFLIHQSHAYAEETRKNEVRTIIYNSPWRLTQKFARGNIIGKCTTTSERSFVLSTFSFCVKLGWVN